MTVPVCTVEPVEVTLETMTVLPVEPVEVEECMCMYVQTKKNQSTVSVIAQLLEHCLITSYHLR